MWLSIKQQRFCPILGRLIGLLFDIFSVPNSFSFYISRMPKKVSFKRVISRLKQNTLKDKGSCCRNLIIASIPHFPSWTTADNSVHACNQLSNLVRPYSVQRRVCWTCSSGYKRLCSSADDVSVQNIVKVN